MMSNNNEQFSRMTALIGDEALFRLQKSHVIVFGLGGVGSFAAEALARAGVGHISLVDNDSVSVTNINRQLVALHSTIGQQKTAVMAERINDICPDTVVTQYDIFYSDDNKQLIDFTKYDYVVDAIDTVSSKLLLIEQCYTAETPVISSMGTGNKLNPAELCVSDIYDTSGCPLARVMRRELKRKNIKRLKVVYSTEQPRKPLHEIEDNLRRSVPGSVSFVPPVAGMILAGEVIKDLIGLQ